MSKVYSFVIMNLEIKSREQAVERSSALADRATRLEVPEVVWWRHSGLRKLYAMMPILFLGSTLTGYDGSLLNGLQTMVPWQDCLFSLVRCLRGGTDWFQTSNTLKAADLVFCLLFKTLEGSVQYFSVSIGPPTGLCI